MRINTQILEEITIIQEKEASFGSTWLSIYWNDEVVAELQIRENKIVHLDMASPTALKLNLMQELIDHEKEICEWVNDE